MGPVKVIIATSGEHQANISANTSCSNTSCSSSDVHTEVVSTHLNLTVNTRRPMGLRF
jgi:hypothetical protein